MELLPSIIVDHPKSHLHSSKFTHLSRCYEDDLPFCMAFDYSASSVIRTSIIRILDYPNPQNNYIHKILMIFIRS